MASPASSSSSRAKEDGGSSSSSAKDPRKAQEPQAAPVYPRKCPHCDKYFPTSTRYHKHVNYHTAARNFKCDFPGCSKAYKRKVDLEDHKVVHLEVKPFRCSAPSCHRTFTTKQSLMSHIGCVRNGLSCAACGLRFRKKAKLQLHWALVHPGVSPTPEGAPEEAPEVPPPPPVPLNTCPDCGKTFQHRTSLEKHILAQHPREGVAAKAKQYKCTGCEETFSSFLEMVHHRREKHPKTHTCDECGFVAQRPEQLKHHKDLVHRNVMVACQHRGCPMTFATKPAMRLHYRVAHLDLREYKCRHCDQAFAYKSVLRKHCEKVHKLSPTEEELKPCRDDRAGQVKAPSKRRRLEPERSRELVQPAFRPPSVQ